MQRYANTSYMHLCGGQLRIQVFMRDILIQDLLRSSGLLLPQLTRSQQLRPVVAEYFSKCRVGCIFMAVRHIGTQAVPVAKSSNVLYAAGIRRGNALERSQRILEKRVRLRVFSQLRQGNSLFANDERPLAHGGGLG